VDLKGNKLVEMSVIEMLLYYGRKLIKELDFRNCIFTFNETVDVLFEFDDLTQINGG
jgi:hypothetical protein